jgi:hypothetical protein
MICKEWERKGGNEGVKEERRTKEKGKVSAALSKW